MTVVNIGALASGTSRAPQVACTHRQPPTRALPTSPLMRFIRRASDSSPACLTDGHLSVWITGQRVRAVLLLAQPEASEGTPSAEHSRTHRAALLHTSCTARPAVFPTRCPAHACTLRARTSWPHAWALVCPSQVLCLAVRRRARPTDRAGRVLAVPSPGPSSAVKWLPLRRPPLRHPPLRHPPFRRLPARMPPFGRLSLGHPPLERLPFRRCSDARHPLHGWCGHM